MKDHYLYTHIHYIIYTISYTLYHTHTCPRADNDLFIAAASTSLNPVASLFDILSEPAKSTRVRRLCVVAPDTLLCPSRFKMTRRCERELY